MQLTHEHIQTLFKFCEKHGVKYYDVQVELVDHLATAIETQMGQSPYYTFEQCLKEEYHAFGPAGFSQFLSEKKAQVERNIKKKRLALLRKSFTPPLIFLTLAILCAPIYLITHHDVTNMKKLQELCIVVNILLGIYWTVQATLYQRQRKKTRSGMQRLKIMLEDVPQVWQACFLSCILTNSIQGWGQFISYNKGNSSFSIISTWLIVNTLCSFILVISTEESRKLHQTVRLQYPDAFVK